MTLDPAKFVQALDKSGNPLALGRRCGPAQHPDCWSLPGCCALAATGHAAAPPTNAMNSRRFISFPIHAGSGQIRCQPRAIKTGKSGKRNGECGNLRRGNLEAPKTAQGQTRSWGDVRLYDRSSTENGSQSAILLCRGCATSRRQAMSAPPRHLAQFFRYALHSRQAV